MQNADRAAVTVPGSAAGPCEGEFMAWSLIVIAGFFETGFAVLRKQSAHLIRLWPTARFAACALISFGLLSLALGRLEAGPAYAVWTGIGAAGTAIVGMAALGESVSALKAVSIGLVVAGVAGVAGVAAWPSLVSSPWMRRCPRSGFSFARRTTRRAMPGSVGERPSMCRLLVSYLPAASLRCQASTLAGVIGTMPAQRLRA